MGFNCGIVGLPNVGKSTLFNAITSSGVEASNYPFCTIDPNVGVVPVPDLRLKVLEEIFRPDKVVPTTIEFLDIAGLVKGASKGEGLGNKFLSHIREVDSIAHVVRCFDDPNVVHVDGSIDPKRDIEIVETELILKDLETVEKKIEDAGKRSKSGDRKIKAEVDLYSSVRSHLSQGRLLRYFTPPDGEAAVILSQLHPLTNKPVMYVCNVHERDLLKENRYVEMVRSIAAKENARVVVVSAGVEAEVAELPAEERTAFLEDLGLRESGLEKMIREGYDLLHLLTFFTAGPKEVHAWTISGGAKAPEAAGEIHSDFQEGFIRAEIMSFDDVARLGSEQAVRDAGLMRTEGKEYLVRDGDIAFFRFRV
ncbi:MAG: redox-regulated ATPase YchF [Ignavibacteria bacterium]|nr:redox-regulated ATPase YchF [Ignavibacteria bacterium]